jgi:hypothetical protein
MSDKMSQWPDSEIAWTLTNLPVSQKQLSPIDGRRKEDIEVIRWASFILPMQQPADSQDHISSWRNLTSRTRRNVCDSLQKALELRNQLNQPLDFF